MAVNAELRARIGADASGFRREMGAVGRIAAGTAAGIAASFAGAFSGRALAGAFAPAIEMETFETQFAVLLGSMDEAQARLKELESFASSTPFELPGIVRASRVLETLTGGAFSGIDALRMVGDAAAVSNQPIEDLASWFGRLYDGIASNRPVGEAMMRLQELGIVSGKVRNEIESLQKSGAAGPDVWAAVTRAMSGYTGMTEKVSQTTSGLISTMRDNWGGIKRDVGEVALPAISDAIRDVLKTMTELRESGKLEEYGETTRKALEGIWNSLKALASLIAANKELLTAAGFTYAGVKVIQAVHVAVVAVKAALVMLTATTAVNTRTTERAAAAHLKHLAALQMSEAGIQQANAATEIYAKSLTGLRLQLSTVTGALGAMAAAAATAWAGYKVGEYIGDKTGFQDFVGDTLGDAMAGPELNELDAAQKAWIDRWKSLTNKNLAGKTFSEFWRKSEARKEAPIGAAGGIAEAAGGIAEAAGEKAGSPVPEFDVMAPVREVEKALDKMRTEAMVAKRTGDEARMALWEALTGGADPDQALTAMQNADIYTRLEEMLPGLGNAKDAVKIVESQADAQVKATREAADIVARKADERRAELQRLMDERRRLMGQLGDAMAGETASQRMSSDADAMGTRSEQTLARADAMKERALASEGTRSDEDRAKRSEAREKARLNRRISSEMDRQRQGLHVTKRGAELIEAFQTRQQGLRQGRAAVRLKEQAEIARMREAQIPLELALAAINKTLNARLPEAVA